MNDQNSKPSQNINTSFEPHEDIPPETTKPVAATPDQIPGDNPVSQTDPVQSTSVIANESNTVSGNNQNNSHGTKSKLIGTIAAVVLLVIAIPVGLFLTRQEQDIRNLAVGESCKYGDTCPGGGVQVCQGVEQLNSEGKVYCAYTGPCSGCDNPAICGNGSCEPGEGNNNCPADCKPSGGTCEGGLSPGQKKYDCTGNKAACRGEAGEGVPSSCNSDGSITTWPSECTNECPVADKSNCDYREECTINNKKGTKLCSGTKDSEGVCKWNAEVSSCGGCTETPAQICNNNGNYEGGLLPGKANPDPNCAAQGGSYCNDGGNFNVCCYSDGNCYQGQIGACKNLGNGAIELIKATAEILEFNCPGQTSSTGSCSENGTSKGIKGPGTYSVSGCGGRQIDAVGYCGSYSFGGTCQTGGSGPTIQCLDIKLYDSLGNRITNPAGTIKPGDTIRVAVSGNTSHAGGISKARFKINGTAFKETSSKNSQGEFYVDQTVSAGNFSVEGQVYNELLGWE